MYILREKHLIKSLEKGKTSPIILLSGLRGCGKSSLMKDIAHSLRRDKPPVRVVEINAQNSCQTEIELLDAAHALGAGVSALLIDNAELIENLIPAIREIHNKYKTTVYLTGQKTLELETLLKQCVTLEHEIIHIHPFSYVEFLEHQSLQETHASFIHYLYTGGLPLSLILPSSHEHSKTLIRLMADSFILENIVERFSVRNPSFISLILEKITRTQGEQISSRAISESFASKRLTISNQAVIDYLEFCKQSGLLLQVPVIDIKTGKTIEAGSSYYFSDTGLRSGFSMREERTQETTLLRADTEKAFENALYIALIDEGYTVAKGRITKGKDFLEYITFICTKNDKKYYLQIVPFSATSSVELQKRKALLSIRDAWPKFLIDQEEDNTSDDGIRVLSARSLLTKDLETLLL